MESPLSVSRNLLLACALAALSACAEQPPKEKPSVEFTDAVSVTATVQKIDLASRHVVLRGPAGDDVEVVVDEAVKNLPQVKVGERVIVDYYRSLAIEVKTPEQAQIGATMEAGVATAQPGEKPAGVMAEQVTVTAEILSIDREHSLVTTEGPKGGLVTIKARDPKKLKNVDNGDKAIFTYNEALAVSVRKADSR